MTVRRVVGIETEYGVSVPSQPGANHMTTSSIVVNSYANGLGRTANRPRWDFEEENPMRDARGFELDVNRGDADAPANDEDLGLANVILTNGARLYVDHAHPEYSAPETTNPLDTVRWDKAGERVMEIAAQRALAIPGNGALHLYKNNTDGKGASYGTHENYLMNRATPFAEIVRHLTPFFVTRQIFCGAGRVGLGVDGRTDGFQLSQRADFFEVEVGLETTLKRPIINTRDEPHADAERYRRLHVIIGDANMSEIATYLKVGTTSLVLAMIEDGWLRESGIDLAIDAPVAGVRDVSYDVTLRRPLRMRDGRQLTAIQIQSEILEQARKYVENRYGSDADPQTKDVLTRWESVLIRLGDDPMQLRTELDWVAKLAMLEGYRERENLGWNAAKLHLVDLQYADVRQDRGLYNRLVARGVMQTLIPAEDIASAVTTPPADTRAYFRGRCLEKYASSVVAASWDSVIFDVGRDSLKRVPTMEPLRGTKAMTEALLDRCDTAADLVNAING